MILKKSICSADVFSQIKEIKNDGDSDSSSKRKFTKKANFSVEALEILDKWVDDHPDYPYPNPMEFEELSKLTSLSIRQVQVWFTNTRKRKLKITRQEYLMKQNEFMRNQVRNSKKLLSNNESVTTRDQGIQAGPNFEEIKEEENVRTPTIATKFVNGQSSKSRFIKQVLFVAEVADLEEICLCESTFQDYIKSLGYCTSIKFAL